MTNAGEHLRDYVWMRKGDEAPERVAVDDIPAKMWAGYQQCDPPASEPKKESK